ncbi:unnamed protein product [Ranitomeya imitator]|uniref:Uncharacterized protein n=1 Tax=Ranitomeya imitator TaxID=111125 RepID=A0ABN9L6M1_9NEOB|nr:unnamed protein product [Ranitomeya imitator]
MATALRRGFQGGVFRTASFSSFTRWTSVKSTDPLGRIADQPASHYKKVCGNAGDLPDPKRPSDYPTVAKKGRPQRLYQQHKNATGSPRIKKLDLPSRTRENLSEKFSKTYRKSRNEDMYDDLESYNSMADPRGFQQSRAEYKSLCYGFGQTVHTSKEEGETLLHKAACNDLSPAEISDFWEKLSCVPEDHMGDLKSNKLFEKLCGRSVEALQLYSHQELIRILRAFVQLKIPTNHPILKAYEKEFSGRVWYLSTNELLLVADMWRCLSFSVPKFLDIMYSYMHLRSINLTLAQAIQLIYIIGEGRRAPEELMEKLEAVVLRYLQTINLEEIGTVCLGFF